MTDRDGATLAITQVRSLIGAQSAQRRTVRALGLRRIHQTVHLPDRPEVRGMVAKVAHLLDVRYPGEGEALDIEPGQQPKGEGAPPAGGSVADEEAADLRAAEEDALAVAGSAAPEDLVQQPPTLTSTDPTDAPKASKGPVEDAGQQSADTGSNLEDSDAGPGPAESDEETQ